MHPKERDTSLSVNDYRSPTLTAPDAYKSPTLVEIGSVHELTLNPRPSRCFWGKKWGGTDGLEFMGITVPVSSC
jgi:hypothetical protein